MNTNVLKELCDGKKRDNAIVFFANSKYRFALAEMLINIQETNPNIYDNIIVYHADFEDEDINKFLLIEPKCIFISYTYEEWEKEYKKPSTSKSVEFVKTYSHQAYVKFRIIELLEYYHKVLFLDLDMLVLDDISELFQIKGAAWRDAIGDFGVKFDKHVPMNEFEEWFSNFPREAHVPNGGLIYISDDNIDYKKCLSDAHEFLLKFMDYFTGAIDELAIAYVIVKNNIPLTILDRNEYNTLSAWHHFSTKIIHFASRDKVWNSEFMQTLFPQWMKNYKAASKIALFESEQIVEHPKTCVRKKLNEETWFQFFRDTDFRIPENLVLTFDFSKGFLQMKYNTDVVYELVLDLYAKNFKSGLWIKNFELLQDRKFVENISNLGFNSLENEKGLYLYTDKKNANDTAKLFNKFYNITFNYLMQYLDKCNEKYTTISSYSLRNEILQLDVEKYFDVIKSVGNRYCILVSGKDEASRYLQEFKEITSLPLNSIKYRGSYIAVINNNENIIENTSENKIQYSFCVNSNNKLWVNMISEGYRLKKEVSSIMINNIEYSMNLRGLNFVIIDRIVGSVVDFFNIDTYGDNSFSINRSNEMIEKIRSLENEQMKTI